MTYLEQATSSGRNKFIRMNVLALQKELLNLIREIHYDREAIDDTQKKVGP